MSRGSASNKPENDGGVFVGLGCMNLE